MQLYLLCGHGYYRVGHVVYECACEEAVKRGTCPSVKLRVN